MKTVIGILYLAKFNESSFETGCGGSDAWVIQIAKEFTKRGNHVIVFCETDGWKIERSGVEYVPYQNLQMRSVYQHFDYFIFTRVFYEAVYNLLVSHGCKNIYLQSHDMFIWNKFAYAEQFIYEPDKYPYLKKFIALTEFHKRKLHQYNNIPYDKLEIIGNGLDSDLFRRIDLEEETEPRDNSILFTSVYTRGGDILVDNVAPLVRKEIPDFKVRICGYAQDSIPEDVRNNESVEVLGMLTKEEYYKEFKKHKVWFLPCTVPEDFGLCVCEAVMCGCDVVSTFEHGMKDVCWPFISLSMKHKFKTKPYRNYHYSKYELDMTDEELQEACQEAADKIIYSIKNYDVPERREMREVFKTFILGEHTWSKVCDKWDNMFTKTKEQ